MKKKTKIYIVVVLWAAALGQFIVNQAVSNDNKIIEAFSMSKSIPLESNVDVSAVFAQGELKISDKEAMLKDLAGKLGIKDGYEIINKKEKDITKSSLIKDGSNGKTIINIASFNDKKEVDKKQYLNVNITLYGNTDSIIYYKEKLEGIFLDIGMKPTSNVYISGSLDGKLSDAQKNDLSTNLMETLQGKEVESQKNGELYTIYGYTPLLKDSIKVAKEKVNINIAMSYDEQSDQTLLHLAVPIINLDY